MKTEVLHYAASTLRAWCSVHSTLPLINIGFDIHPRTREVQFTFTHQPTDLTVWIDVDERVALSLRGFENSQCARILVERAEQVIREMAESLGIRL